MKIIFFIFLVNQFYVTYGQSSPGVSVIDFVKVAPDRQKEALYYYENNWKVYRDIALQKGFIKSYELLQTKPDSMSNFDLILITEYADSVQFKLGEERFQLIIKEVRPDGPRFLNNFKANDFRKSAFLKQAVTLLKPDEKKRE